MCCLAFFLDRSRMRFPHRRACHVPHRGLHHFHRRGACDFRHRGVCHFRRYLSIAFYKGSWVDRRYTMWHLSPTSHNSAVRALYTRRYSKHKSLTPYLAPSLSYHARQYEARLGINVCLLRRIGRNATVIGGQYQKLHFGPDYGGLGWSVTY